jgi:hypothetical protein
MSVLRRYWSWLGHRLRLSQTGRMAFTGVLLLGVAGATVAWAQGEREGGAPLVMITLVLAGVVILDAIGRRVVTAVRRFADF